jgi:hypothetical protein
MAADAVVGVTEVGPVVVEVLRVETVEVVQALPRVRQHLQQRLLFCARHYV